MIILLDKLMIAVKALKVWVEQKIKETSNQIDSVSNKIDLVQDDLNLTKNNLDTKMDKTNPVGAGSFSMNRKADTIIGNYSHAEGKHATASGDCSHAEGENTTASGGCSHTEGADTTASGSWSHAEGFYATASGSRSHAEGEYTMASGSCSHAEGLETTASGSWSHAEGEHTMASGNGSHAEGEHTMASGSCSHAEGFDTIAFGNYSHAEGYGYMDRCFASGDANATNYLLNMEIPEEYIGAYIQYNCTISKIIAISSFNITVDKTLSKNSLSSANVAILRSVAGEDYSHIEGYRTVAASPYQHVQGRNNIEDTEDKYAHIVGNGEPGNYSNAHTLDWDGNAWYSGDVYVGSTSGTNKDEGSKKLATEEYVDEAVSNINIPEIDTTLSVTGAAASAYSTGLAIKEVRNIADGNTAAISLILNGTDPDTIDGVKDLIDYVNEHGAEVIGIKNDISEVRTYAEELIEGLDSGFTEVIVGMYGDDVPIEDEALPTIREIAADEVSNYTPDWKAQEGEEGYIKNKPTKEDALLLLMEAGMINPIAAAANEIYVNENNVLYTF